ncbi:hypothetical protein [Methylobacterium longum]|uniref:STAS/SEC14 domain-containing protein n=1 Tax=Methylobacterium longum TaxID=767694 RepID=A0ABT8AYP5_9HYPH|nr:hypothetical protein [Methylobacterium longum]MDN3575124.1 hypothetical protein [Methylobacterium longum]GJE15095.1 hypothetical protein FOHLNKBM_6173 [Methylobacterium longum]
MNLRLQPVQVATGSDDQESQLVFHEGFLVAVLVCLSEQHDDDAGKWFLEAGFGQIDDLNAPLFASLDEAQGWILDQLQ